MALERVVLVPAFLDDAAIGLGPLGVSVGVASPEPAHLMVAIGKDSSAEAFPAEVVTEEAFVKATVPLKDSDEAMGLAVLDLTREDGVLSLNLEPLSRDRSLNQRYSLFVYKSIYVQVTVLFESAESFSLIGVVCLAQEFDFRWGSGDKRFQIFIDFLLFVYPSKEL